MMGRTELCAWLRANSSGIYRPAAEAADEIEHLAAASDQHFAQAMKNGASANAYRAVLERIAALDPATDSEDGFNEWGEADCFNKAQAMARAVLVLPNVRAKLPAEAGAVSLVRDDAPCAADQAYSACRSGSA